MMWLLVAVPQQLLAVIVDLVMISMEVLLMFVVAIVAMIAMQVISMLAVMHMVLPLFWQVQHSNVDSNVAMVSELIDAIQQWTMFFWFFCGKRIVSNASKTFILKFRNWNSLASFGCSKIDIIGGIHPTDDLLPSGPASCHLSNLRLPVHLEVQQEKKIRFQ